MSLAPTTADRVDPEQLIAFDILRRSRQILGMDPLDGYLVAAQKIADKVRDLQFTVANGDGYENKWAVALGELERWYQAARDLGIPTDNPQTLVAALDRRFYNMNQELQELRNVQAQATSLPDGHSTEEVSGQGLRMAGDEESSDS